MDIKIIVALTTLAGIFVTALFGVTGYFYKVKLEEKKKRKICSIYSIGIKVFINHITIQPV